MCIAASDFLLSFGYVLSEFLAYLSGLRASTGTAGMNGCKGLSGNRTERSEGELRNAPCIQNGSCYDAHKQTDKQGTEYIIKKKKIEAIDTEEKRGSLGEPIGKGDSILPLSAPLWNSFFKKNGFQEQVVAGARGDQRQKWRCLEWYHAKNHDFLTKTDIL